MEACVDISGLSTLELCAEVERLAVAERRIEWLLCRHLAELADRLEAGAPELGSFGDVYHLARVRFGMGVRRTRERVRIGRALGRLPPLEQAFALHQPRRLHSLRMLRASLPMGGHLCGA